MKQTALRQLEEWIIVKDKLGQFDLGSLIYKINSLKPIEMQQIEDAFLEACMTYSGTETAMQSDITNCNEYIETTLTQD